MAITKLNHGVSWEVDLCGNCDDIITTYVVEQGSEDQEAYCRECDMTVETNPAIVITLDSAKEALEELGYE